MIKKDAQILHPKALKIRLKGLLYHTLSSDKKQYSGTATLMLASLTNTSIYETNSWKKSLMPTHILGETDTTFFFLKNVLIVTCFQATVSDGSRTSGCLNLPEGRND